MSPSGKLQRWTAISLITITNSLNKICLRLLFYSIQGSRVDEINLQLESYDGT
jgi:hypothetical protein